LEHFSLPARVVIVLSVLAAVGGTAGYIVWVAEDLPPGSYPVWLFAIPVVVGAGVRCAAALAFLRLCGIPIYRQDNPVRLKEDGSPSRSRAAGGENASLSLTKEQRIR
jgi:hypothetical protein